MLTIEDVDDRTMSLIAELVIEEGLGGLMRLVSKQFMRAVSNARVSGRRVRRCMIPEPTWTKRARAEFINVQFSIAADTTLDETWKRVISIADVVRCGGIDLVRWTISMGYPPARKIVDWSLIYDDVECLRLMVEEYKLWRYRCEEFIPLHNSIRCLRYIIDVIRPGRSDQPEFVKGAQFDSIRE